MKGAPRQTGVLLHRRHAGTATASKGDGRRAYLAEQFTEFCADSFMHFALREAALRAHVNSLPDTEVAVKRAWEYALPVLDLYEDYILGIRPAGPPRCWPVTGSRLPSRSSPRPLQGLGLEVPDLEKLLKLLNRLRRAWQGLTPHGRQRHRSEALTALDMYVMKVQRRRPAQLYLGPAASSACNWRWGLWSLGESTSYDSERMA